MNDFEGLADDAPDDVGAFRVAVPMAAKESAVGSFQERSRKSSTGFLY